MNRSSIIQNYNLGPVFIVGCQRSGTSAVWRALKQHSHFWSEHVVMNDMPEAWDKELWYIHDYLKGRNNEQPTQHHKWSIDAEYNNEFFRFVSDFIRRNHGGPNGRWISAHPRDAFYLKEILYSLPTATAIFLVRHPQEVVWSMLHAPWQKPLSREGFLSQAMQCAHHWNKFAEACASVINSSYNKKVLIIRNEEIREAPTEFLQKILDHISSPYEEAVMNSFLSGAYHSSFLKRNEPLHKIANSHQSLLSDHEFCSVVSETTKFWRREFDYNDLADQSNSHPPAETLEDNTFANEQYWQQQLDWYEKEIARRKRTLPVYHHQEMYLGEYFQRYAEAKGAAKQGKPRVLEFGYGFGRHLSYLKTIPSIDFFGCDISPYSIYNAKNWACKDWTKAHLKQIEPRTTLPYPDKWFDVVFTVSVLIHVKPEYLENILRELSRICRGHILHIENPFAKGTHFTSTMHDGCWAHALPKAYEVIGLDTELLPEFTKIQTIYRVPIVHNDDLPSIPRHMVSKMLDLEETIGDEIKVQENQVRRFWNQEQQLRKQEQHLKKELEELQESYICVQSTRAMRINRWLERHRKLNSAIQYVYDNAATLYKRKEGTGSHAHQVPELFITDPSNKIISACHPRWQGVRSATETQNSNILLLPEMNSAADVQQAIELIRPHDPAHVILNGFFDGYDNFARAIRNKLPNTKVYYVHHGSFYQMLEIKNKPNVMARFLRLHREGVFERIGFTKHGMAEVFNAFGINAYLVLNGLPCCRSKHTRSWNSPVRIFIPATDHPRKNLYTQLMGAMMIEEIDEVHIIGNLDIHYLKEARIPLDRIVIHPTLSRNTVLDLIDKSTLVLYVTLSECAPMVPLESFVAGVPCLSGANHGLLRDDPFLEKMLVVDHEDDPIYIANAILRVKDNYDQICQSINQFEKKYKEKAIRSLHQFIEIKDE
ncbi:MAG: sulfotransferase [Desulfobacula sp.]|nr:sulfotransferase [Desulfobacula sp.]